VELAVLVATATQMPGGVSVQYARPCQGVLTIILTVLLVPEKSSGTNSRRFRRRSLAFFQAQPEGPVLIFPPSALSLAHVEQPHRTRAALRDKK